MHRAVLVVAIVASGCGGTPSADARAHRDRRRSRLVLHAEAMASDSELCTETSVNGCANVDAVSCDLPD